MHGAKLSTAYMFCGTCLWQTCLIPTTRQRRAVASMPKHTAKVESKKARRSGLFYEGIPFL